MAAADSARSRGVAAYRTTKGLFFISTLLCLICFASSLTSNDQLEKSKENYQKLKQTLDNLKAKHLKDSAMISEIMSDYLTLMDQMMALVKKAKAFLPDDFPPVETFMESMKVFMKKTKTQIDDSNEELEELIQNSEKKLAVLEKLIQFLEQQQAEL